MEQLQETEAQIEPAKEKKGELLVRVDELGKLQKRVRAQQRKDLVSIDAINDWFKVVVEDTRKELFKIPAELAEELARETNAERVRSIIEVRIHGVMVEMRKKHRQD